VFFSDQAKSDGPEFKVLYVGSITQRKGIRYLLEAFRQLDFGDCSLTMIGHSSSNVDFLASHDGNVRHIPQIAKLQLAEIYRQSSVFVLPSLVEGLPFVVLEAMASGLPVIVTPRGPDHVVRDGIDGFVVPPNDADAIAHRLLELRADPDLRRQMGGSAREQAKQFTQERYVEHALDVIVEAHARRISEKRG
jgi:glycosyltransferase involved in cell wall biosynthesis